MKVDIKKFCEDIMFVFQTLKHYLKATALCSEVQEQLPLGETKESFSVGVPCVDTYPDAKKAPQRTYPKPKTMGVSQNSTNLSEQERILLRPVFAIKFSRSTRGSPARSISTVKS